MENNAAHTNSTPEYPREIYEPVLATSIELDEYLRKEFTINYFDLDGDHEVHTCYGDIKMTIDALMDYTNLLDTVCEQWKLEGYHRAVYQYHSDMLRKFSGKLQAALGYDYAATLEKCRKKQNRKEKDSDIGEDGITLAAKRRKSPDKKEADNGDSADKKDSGDEGSPNGGSKEDASDGNGNPLDDDAEETVCDRHSSRNKAHPRKGHAEKNSSVPTEAEKRMRPASEAPPQIHFP